MKRAALLIVVSSFLLAADEPSKAKRDPQASFEPRSGPGAGQALLGKFVGDWDVNKAFFPRAGEPVRAVGTCRQTMDHGGRFLRSEFVFRQGATESTGTGLIGFEPETGRFTSVWVDSRRTQMSFRQSDAPFDGKTIRLESRSLDPDAPSGEARRSRTVTTLDADGRRIVHRQFALGADGSERLMMELVLTRQPAGEASKGR